MPLPWIVIADDLTGAGDCAAAFAQRGSSSIIWLHGHPPTQPCDIPVFETASRNLSPDEAYKRVHAAALKAPAHIFKKIDSTFLGNLGAEIRAARDAAQAAHVLIAPMHPTMGRTLEDGWLVLHGERTDKHIPTLLAAQGLADGYELIDLAAIPEALARPGRIVLAGAGAAAEALASHLGPNRSRPSFASRTKRFPLVIAGSTNLVTREQLVHLDPKVPILFLDRKDHSNEPLLATIREHSALIICGGDTARAVAKYLGAHGIRVEGEAARGVPYGRWIGGAANTHPVATKAGGFGRPDTLVNAVQFLRRLS